MARANTDDTWRRTVVGLTRLVERVTPWLLELGNWIFGALIAFDLLVLAALLTVGPVDTAVLIATAAIALALPPDVAGFGLLRLAADMKRVDLERVATQAFVEAGFQADPLPEAGTRRDAEQRRARVVLGYSYVLLGSTAALTFVGVTAALWHMAWWIGAVFVVMSAVSVGIFFIALGSTAAGMSWRAPAGSTERKDDQGGP